MAHAVVISPNASTPCLGSLCVQFMTVTHELLMLQAQAKYNASEMASWEQEQKRQSDAELAAMEAAAEQEALMRAEEKQVRLSRCMHSGL